MNKLPDVDMLDDVCHLSSGYHNNTNEESTLVHVCTLMDVDPPHNNHREEITIATKQPPKKQDKPRTREPYRKCTPQQIEKLFNLVIEVKTAKEAALMPGINVRTAQKYVKIYKDDEQMSLPGVEHKPRKGRPGKLKEDHPESVLQFVNQNPTAILADIKRSLCNAFDGLTVSMSALHGHLVNKCFLTPKNLEKLPAERNSDKVIALRKERVKQWEQMDVLDFATNCVFIDEAGFNMYMANSHIKKDSFPLEFKAHLRLFMACDMPINLVGSLSLLFAHLVGCTFVFLCKWDWPIYTFYIID